MGLSDPTISLLLRDPDKLTAKRLRQLIKLLGLDPITVLRWLGYADRDIKKLKEDAV